MTQNLFQVSKFRDLPLGSYFVAGPGTYIGDFVFVKTMPVDDMFSRCRYNAATICAKGPLAHIRALLDDDNVIQISPQDAFTAITKSNVF